MSGLSGLSGLTASSPGGSPAEVEAAMSREAMHAAAAAAVQAAMGGVTAAGVDAGVLAKEKGGGEVRARRRRVRVIPPSASMYNHRGWDWVGGVGDGSGVSRATRRGRGYEQRRGITRRRQG